MRTLLLGLVACGRVHFDALDDGDIARCDPGAPFTSVRPFAAVNTIDGEGGMRLSDDELVAYYHSNYMLGGFGIHETTRSSKSDDFPRGMYTGILGLFASLTPDRLSLVFDTYDDIRVATRATVSEPFVGGGSTLPLINTANIEYQSFLGTGARYLYFGRALTTNDLFVAPWPELTPERPLGEIDLPGDDRIPVISADELTFYWARFVNGQNEIWIARRTSDTEPFSGATKVAELDSPFNDAPTWLSPDQCRLYFESDRNPGMDYDLFVAEREP